MISISELKNTKNDGKKEIKQHFDMKQIVGRGDRRNSETTVIVNYISKKTEKNIALMKQLNEIEEDVKFDMEIYSKNRFDNINNNENENNKKESIRYRYQMEFP